METHGPDLVLSLSLDMVQVREGHKILQSASENLLTTQIVGPNMLSAFRPDVCAKSSLLSCKFMYLMQVGGRRQECSVRAVAKYGVGLRGWF